MERRAEARRGVDSPKGEEGKEVSFGWVNELLKS